MELFEKRKSTPVWVNFENPRGEKGMGSAANHGDKGSAYTIDPGDTLTICDITGSGIVRRIWITLYDRSPEMLKGLKLKMYWDGAQTPDVDVPLCDFFCMNGGTMYAFENELFSSPEGRSFCSFVPMPFFSRALITVVNTTDKYAGCFFCQVDATLGDVDEKAMYFHASHMVSESNIPGNDVVLLPTVHGEGRYLGASVLVNADFDQYGGIWWGEGEMKLYLDGDGEYPTLCGTGSEDYLGTAWGQGCFTNRTQGCLECADGRAVWYRFHTLDPVFFTSDLRVCIQAMGGGYRRDVIRLLENGASLKPIVVGGREFDFNGNGEDWVNFYRSDRYEATIYYYLSEKRQIPG